MRVLGIETSCDETAAAVVGRDEAGRPQILANVVASQFAEHAAYGGVVPELAARAHLATLDGVIREALRKAGAGLDAIDAVAATSGPGLIGGLLVGSMTGRSLAAAVGKPFIAVNHLEGHALTARLSDDAAYPYLMLLVSGGHSQILRVEGLGRYTRWATTIDDALGEAFDKTAKLLGLPFPGGPSVEARALSGDPARFVFPRPLKGRETLNFSFSGLKTAVRQAAEQSLPLDDKLVADICASFQQAVCDSLSDRVGRAIARWESENSDEARLFVAAGGVAANRAIRSALGGVCAARGWTFAAPPLPLCGDNGAVIAWAGLERLEAGLVSPFDAPVRARWPLDEESAPVVGSGKKGAKA